MNHNLENVYRGSVICRDKNGYFVEIFDGKQRVRSEYFDTWEDARAEQIEIDADNRTVKSHETDK